MRLISETEHYQVFTEPSSDSNKVRAECPCHCGKEILQDFPRSFITYLLARPPPVGPSQFFFLRIEPGVSRMYAKNPLFSRERSLELPAWRLKFVSLISRKFLNGTTDSFVARTITSQRKNRSKFASVTNRSVSLCARPATILNLLPDFCSPKDWFSPANRSFHFSRLFQARAPIPAT